MGQRWDPAFWARVRADYRNGATAASCARTHGVSLSTLRHRAKREGWRRADQPAPAPPPGVEAMAHAAFLEAQAALARGDVKAAAEALKLATLASGWAHPESLPKTRARMESEAWDARQRKQKR